MRRIRKQKLFERDDDDPLIRVMHYNSARDDLFLADYRNDVLRKMRLRDNSDDLRDVYRASDGGVYSVCQMSDSDALFVCLEELNIYWLVALRRSENVWREAQRVQTERMGWISCALSDSRVLIGQCKSTSLELFLVKSGLCIERLNRIQISKQYDWFTANCGSESLVAMSYENSKRGASVSTE